MRIEGILKNISLSKSLIIGNNFISFKYWNNLKVVFNLKGIVSAISSDPPLFAKRYQCPLHNGLIKYELDIQLSNDIFALRVP